jgi:hypothetical protein|eukprot:3864096-Prymnesium_polylepis.1
MVLREAQEFASAHQPLLQTAIRPAEQQRAVRALAPLSGTKAHALTPLTAMSPVSVMDHEVAALPRRDPLNNPLAPLPEIGKGGLTGACQKSVDSLNDFSTPRLDSNRGD